MSKEEVKDCRVYENCLDNNKILLQENQSDMLHMVAVGCWGVYCNDGEYIIVKQKKNQLNQSKVTRGQGKVSNALIKYAEQYNVTDMYLAGDNVYQLGISTKNQQEVDNFIRNKQSILEKLTGQELDPLKNFDIELQLSEGFERCFGKANIGRFFTVIGNHDIETCDILTKEYTYNRWYMPSLYYNVIYEMKNFKINVIVLDTNMFEEKPVTCTGGLFTEKQINTQTEWAISVSKDGDWNIVIGHIPYLANGHKKEKHPVQRKNLQELIKVMKPELYICADEHNQQFIKDDYTSIVVAGSGGTSLDDIIKDDQIKGTLYQNSDFGFVSYKISKNQLEISFISVENKVLFSHIIKR